VVDRRWIGDPRFLPLAWAACNRPETCRERRTPDDPCWRCQEQAASMLRLAEVAGFVLEPRPDEPDHGPRDPLGHGDGLGG
jgi:hypothetical protein